MKTCSRCKIEYPATIEHFGRNKGTKDGLCLQCKACRRESYKRRKEEADTRKREYYERHKEEIEARERARQIDASVKKHNKQLDASVKKHNKQLETKARQREHRRQKKTTFVGLFTKL